jgi:cyanophycinase
MWQARPSDSLSLLGLHVDVLGEGCRYDLVNRHAYPPQNEHNGACSLPVSTQP